MNAPGEYPPLSESSAENLLGQPQQGRPDLSPHVEAGMTFDDVPEGLNGKVPSNIDAVDATRQGHGSW